MSIAQAVLEIRPGPDLARRVADGIAAIARAKDGPVSAALSGSTPRRPYKTLATKPWRARLSLGAKPLVLVRRAVRSSL